MLRFTDYWEMRKRDEDYRPRAVRSEAEKAYDAGAAEALQDAAYQARHKLGGEPAWLMLQRLADAARRRGFATPRQEEEHRDG